MFSNIDTIIAGAGITGVTIARKLAESGKKVLILEKSRNIGGNCFDYRNSNGILVQKYGPHIFHTDNKKVWDFLSRFTTWEPYIHKVGVSIEGNTVPLPFNLNTLSALFPGKFAEKLEEKLLNLFEYGSRIPILELRNSNDDDLNFLANYIYEKVFLNYTLKQWGGQKPEEIDLSVSARVPVVISRNNSYFSDKYQGMPTEGFTELIRNMSEHKNIKIMYNTDIKEIIKLENDKIIIDNYEFKGSVYYTGPIDELFDYKYGELPYRSVNIVFKDKDTEGCYQDYSVVNYPNNYNFTRITEFKHFQDKQPTNGTSLCMEYPQEYIRGTNRPYYVINNDENQKLYQKYNTDVSRYANLKCAGRLGEYRYYDMDDAVEAALKLVETEI